MKFAWPRPDWEREFKRQNRLLKRAGDEPLTPQEFLSCRLEDAKEDAREARIALKLLGLPPLECGTPF